MFRCVIRCSGSLYVYLEPTSQTVTVTDNAGVILKQTKDGLVAPSEDECKKLGNYFSISWKGAIVCQKKSKLCSRS